MQRKSFDRVKEGDSPSAKQYNELLEAVEMLSGILISGGSMLEGPFGPIWVPADDPQIQFVQVRTDDLTGVPHAESVNELAFDDDVSDGSDPWVDLGTDEDNVAGPFDSVWLAGERTMVMRHSAAGVNVLFPFLQYHIAKLDGTLSEGSTATASIWEVQPSGFDDSNKNVTVYDWMLPAGESLPSGTKIVIIQHRQSGRWIVVAASC